MSRRRSLSFRLFLSYLLLAAIAAAALFGTARLLGPVLFDDDVTRIGQRFGWGDDAPGNGPGRGTGAQGDAAIGEELRSAYSNSLNVAFGVALGVGAVAALAGAAIFSRRILRPLDGVRNAVRRMASGSYGEHVPEPPVTELADLARDVNGLGAELAAAEERRARLVSDLAHEMRTPITSLDGFVEGLEDGVFEPDPETLAAMRTETSRLQRLAADLGALSRADEQAFDLRLEPVDAGAILSDSVRGLAPSFAAAGVRLELTDLPPLPVAADPDRLTQVFANLLRNALAHTPAGAAVHIGAERGDGIVSVVVADDGDGIAPEHLPHVFERFYRGSDRSAGGTGIGLTIARGIARAHGGDISAASAGVGAGAVFTVSLPARPTDQPSAGK